jgi:cytochrome c oxidase subunit I+III
MPNELFTMHGSPMMYLFVIPVLEGFAIFLLPFMLGNREMPFPRLGQFSFFTFLLGGILFYTSFLFNAVPDAGWFAYVPLSGPEYSPGLPLDFWLLGLGVAEVAAIAAGIESLSGESVALSRVGVGGDFVLGATLDGGNSGAYGLWGAAGLPQWAADAGQ